MRRIGVVTVARSDYGIYHSLLAAIKEDPELELRIFATGMHLSPRFGQTVAMIEQDGFEVTERIESLVDSDSPQAIAESIGRGVVGFAEVFTRTPPDILVVLGDRFDMYAAALAALPFKIPVAHIHGGEVTQGAMDEALRHSLTKLSHLHFVATEDSAQRVRQLGEEPWRVTVSGAPALDVIDTIPRLSLGELNQRFGLAIQGQPLLVTFHPVTLQFEQAVGQTRELLAAIELSGCPAVFTAPNADTCGIQVRAMIEEFVQRHPECQFVENLGQQGYFSMMAESCAMVGNSSSGIIEAASFGLPVVNVGLRQGGRFRGKNVLDVGHSREQILAGIRQAVDPEFRAEVRKMANPYRSKGRPAGVTICEILKAAALDDNLILKRFHDLITTET